MLALVDNAIAHSEKGTRVEVRSAAEDGQVRVDVVDHGDGVDVADVEGLTRRFSRGDSGSGGRRVGLGLALVTQIVRSHGGRLEVTETPGGGATFTLLIPSASDAEALPVLPGVPPPELKFAEVWCCSSALSWSPASRPRPLPTAAYWAQETEMQRPYAFRGEGTRSSACVCDFSDCLRDMQLRQASVDNRRRTNRVVAGGTAASRLHCYGGAKPAGDGTGDARLGLGANLAHHWA